MPEGNEPRLEWTTELKFAVPRRTIFHPSSYGVVIDALKPRKPWILRGEDYAGVLCTIFGANDSEREADAQAVAETVLRILGVTPEAVIEQTILLLALQEGAEPARPRLRLLPPLETPD